MVKFKENTFVKGNYEELMEIAKAIEEKGATVNYYGANSGSNHLWYDRNQWGFSSSLDRFCEHGLTKSQLYEAYGIVDFSILNDTDVFYIETFDCGKWLYQGLNPSEHCERISVYLDGFSINKDIGKLTDKENVKLVRLATTEEIEPYKKHFKLQNMEKKPKFKKGDTVRCIGENKITIHGEESSGWEKEKEFVIDRVSSWTAGNVYFPETGHGVWEEHLELVTNETRQIQITRETAVEWFNSTDEILKQLALSAFPELDEYTPKNGDLCLFSITQERRDNNLGTISFFDKIENGMFKSVDGCRFNYCKKIKTIEFY